MLKGSAGHDSFTNVETLKSVAFSANANVAVVPHSNGTSTVSANGTFSIGGPNVGLLHINGRATFVYNDVLAYVESYELIAGRVTDICTLID